MTPAGREARLHIPGFSIRRVRDADLPRLVELDRAGTQMLAKHGYPALLEAPVMDETAFRHLLSSHEGWVVTGGDDLPGGYAISRGIGDMYWLREMTVDPRLNRRGLGSALLETVVDHARNGGYRHVGLSTFDDVPFNRPFYARRGFRVVSRDGLPDAVLQQIDEETPSGVALTSRVAMTRDLAEA